MFLVDPHPDTAACAERVRELAAQIHAANAQLVDLVADLTADGTWNDSGDWRSVAHWLGVNCGLTSAEAHQVARVAAARHTMPMVMDHARAGTVSLGVAALAARVATPGNDQVIADMLTTATPAQAARVLATYRDLRDSEQAATPAEPAETGGSGETSEADETGPDPRESRDQRNSDASERSADRAMWRTWFDDLGNWRVSGRAPAEIGALLDQAWAAAMAAVRRDHAPRNTAPADVTPADRDRRRAPADSAPVDESGLDRGPCNNGRRPQTADVLRRLADLALDAARQTSLQTEGGGHFNVGVVIDIDTFVSGTLGPDSTCRLESGTPLAPGVVQQLAEEGTLQIMWEQRGIPLKLGNEVRFASRTQQRALRRRDKGCAVPGCDATRHLHAHHVVPFPQGPTDLDNLVLLCAFHHRRVHRGGWEIRVLPGQQFEFVDSGGQVVGPRNAPASEPLRAVPTERRRLDHAGRLDAFALDVLLHALLTERTPHVGRTAQPNQAA